jgi:hypothetical protein
MSSSSTILISRFVCHQNSIKIKVWASKRIAIHFSFKK